MRLKVAIVVHGRFHAFDLAHALIERGQDVTVLTNYPKWAVQRFGVPKDRVRSFWPHGVLSRVARTLEERGIARYPEAWLHSTFGRWADRELTGQRWDVVHTWSGVSEEIHHDLSNRSPLNLMMRGSSHIRTQAKLLEEESLRTGVHQERPSDWIIAREEREYRLAEKIIVLSTFAVNSFVTQGVPRSKLALLPLGASVEAFRASPDAMHARRARILSGKPLRVLYVGALSFRKGLWDMANVLEANPVGRYDFRCVGPSTPDVAPLVARLDNGVTLLPKIPQHKLPSVYAWGDIFFFPTIEDGYAVVLAQAAAAGLPILTTTNCAGPDLIRDGAKGWVVPIRSPRAINDQLMWCDTHRVELAKLADQACTDFRPRDWDDVAADFERLCVESRAEMRSRISAKAIAGGS
jgi:glycosyltransferase involved in cell wall biosynthesis